MARIYKYQLDRVVVVTDVAVSMPDGAKVLSVGVTGGMPCVWALVDPTRSLRSRTFLLAPTGHDIPDAAVLSFLGTLILDGSATVIHVFEVHEK